MEPTVGIADSEAMTVHPEPSPNSPDLKVDGHGHAVVGSNAVATARWRVFRGLQVDLAVAATFLAGTIVVAMAPVLMPRAVAVIMLIIGLAGWVLGRRWGWVGAALLGAAWATLHAWSALAGQLPPVLEGTDVVLHGRVTDLPDAQARRTRFLFKVDSDGDQPLALRGKRLQLSWYDDFGAEQIGPRARLHAGSRWQFRLRLRAPRGLSNPGGFDSERYAVANRIAASGLVRTPEEARQVSAPQGIDAWRERMATRIDRELGPVRGRYIKALALGDTRGLDDADWDVLRAAGLTHLIAISGFHVGLVAALFSLFTAGLWRLIPGLARYLPRRHACGLVALAAAAGYGLMAGLSLPTVRTVLMICVVVVARLWRRPVATAQVLALALLSVLVFDPLAVLVAGFWLSFLGVAWLLWCMPTAGHSRLGDFLSAQGVATIGLLPVSVALFGQASAAGPIANLVAIPWWTFVVVPLSLLGTGLDALHTGAGEPVWGAAAWCFELSWPWFQWLAHGRFALWWLPEASLVALPLAMLGAFWMLLPRGLPGRGLGALLWLALVVPDRELPRQGEVDLTAFDVGQGLSVLVRTAGHTLLYDTGPAVKDGFDAGDRVVVPALHADAVARVDRIVVSHSDNDHAGGLDAVRAQVGVGRVLAPMGSGVIDDAPCLAGEGWEWEGVRFRFLHPARGFPYLDNESSCVLRIESAYGAVLLPGDIGEVIESRLLRDEPDALRADVLFAPHHGSAGSSIPAFVRATGARLVLVSTGYGNRFGHPRPEVVARWQATGAEVLNTADAGALRVWLDREGLQLRERRRWRRHWWDAAERSRVAAILSAGH